VVRNSRADVVACALGVLDTWGLADLSMRRLGAELGVQPSALYHHVASKQVLLAAVADELLARGPATPRPAAWDAALAVVCSDLREAMLAYRDGAELVATVRAFGLGAQGPHDELLALLGSSGLPPATAQVGATTLLHFVLGHTVDEQTHLQAGSAGAIDDAPREGSAFVLGVELVLDGLRLRRGAEPALTNRGRPPRR
jgi:AcrR family transcriptional regulator